MEAIIRNVQDIESGERRVLEHVIGQKLKENQQLIIQVVTLAMEPEKRESHDDLSPRLLPDWCSVYAGLTDEQVADVEEVILRRPDLT